MALSFCHKKNRTRMTQPLCWLAQEKLQKKGKMKHPRRIRKRIRKRMSPNKKRGNEDKETSQETSRLQSPYLHFNSSSMELRDEPNNKVREISVPTIHPQSIKRGKPKTELEEQCELYQQSHKYSGTFTSNIWDSNQLLQHPHWLHQVQPVGGA